MKAKDLKNYKILDITQLSGSPWNSAEKVLGLDENDKVVMAEPEAVTYDYVDNAIEEAIETETARTEDVYAKKSEIPSLDNYYTKSETYSKEEVDAAIADVDVSDQLADYAKKTEVASDIASATAYTISEVEAKGYAMTTAVTQDIQTAIATETARTENTYAKIADVPSLDDYYTKDEVDEEIADAIAEIPSPDMSNYYTKSEVDTSISAATEDMATKTWVAGQQYATKVELSALTETVETSNEVIASSLTELHNQVVEISGTTPDLSNYYTKSEVDSEISSATDDMATETWVEEQGYLTEHQDISGKLDVSTFDTYTGATETILEGKADVSDIPDVSTFVTSGDVENQIDNAMAAETARTESTYAKPSQIPSLAGYATESYVDAADSAATATTTGWVESQGYLTEHQDLSAYAKTTAVTESIQTAIAAETARTESTYAKIGDVPSLDGYWTSAQTNSAIAEASAATTGWVETQGYLTQHQDISGKLDVSTFETYTGATDTILEGKADISDIPDVSGFVTSGDVETQIGTAMAAETARTESTYLKEHQDISGKLDKTDFNTYTGATETALNGKVDLTTYTAYTGSTATAIAAKQDTLVSGTNIKTINNESILGSGNITIQGGGGGGGETVVELTKAQYEALDPPASDTTYIITDAETVDLNNYAMASGLTELSGTVQTLSSTKADKASTTARSGYYIPSWNEQGIITGTYAQCYTKYMSINGSNNGSFLTQNNNNLASFFAPTTAGTAGQPLLSNGSGAPGWGGYKFAFITQTQYDALATKDATTIYFITGD